MLPMQQIIGVQETPKLEFPAMDFKCMGFFVQKRIMFLCSSRDSWWISEFVWLGFLHSQSQAKLFSLDWKAGIMGDQHQVHVWENTYIMQPKVCRIPMVLVGEILFLYVTCSGRFFGPQSSRKRPGVPTHSIPLPFGDLQSFTGQEEDAAFESHCGDQERHGKLLAGGWTHHSVIQRYFSSGLNLCALMKWWNCRVKNYLVLP